MGGETRTIPLGDAASVLTGFPFKSSHYTDSSADFRLLRGDNVAQGRIRWDGAKRWPSSNIAAVSDYLLRPGDVILAMDRPWIDAGLKYATLAEADCPALLVQRVACLRAKPGTDQRFLACVIGSRSFTDYVLGVQTGTAVPHISASQIRSFPFPLLELRKQQAIGELLGSLDDKVELNRRMARTVEQMARALFRSWFIDFDPVRAKVQGRHPGIAADTADHFPTRFGIDGLPEGWDPTPLTSMARFLNGLALQKFPASPGAPSLPVIKIAEMRAGIKPNSGRASIDLPSADYIVEDGDHLFSWSGSLTQCLWSHGKGALNQHLFKVIPNGYPAWLLYFAVDHFLPEFQAIASDKAVTMGHIQRRHLDEAMVALPHPEIIEVLDRTMDPLFKRLNALPLEIRTLAGLRDTLLPKLISGELRITDAEALVEEAA